MVELHASIYLDEHLPDLTSRGASKLVIDVSHEVSDHIQELHKVGLDLSTQQGATQE